MKTIRRIAVSTDQSDESRLAFPAAAALAKEFDAELMVIQLAEFPTFNSGLWMAGEAGLEISGIERYLERLEGQLEELVRKQPELKDVDPSAHLVREGTFEAYEKFLASEKVDLLVIATHGRGGVKRLVLGSFAEEVLRHAPCPILLVKRPKDGAPPAFPPRRILVPTDFSANNAPALETAKLWARRFGAEVRLLHVIEHALDLYGVRQDLMPISNQLFEGIRKDADSKLRALVADEWSGIRNAYVIRAGMPVAETVREIQEYKPDLVILGTHGRTGWHRLLLGSVAEGVLRRAPCPVLALRGPEDEGS
jgi:nucleotide-binding universal stress UspA family protein